MMICVHCSVLTLKSMYLQLLYFVIVVIMARVCLRARVCVCVWMRQIECVSRRGATIRHNSDTHIGTYNWGVCVGKV